VATEGGPDSVTEITERSWLQRVGQSFAGVLFGFALIAVACVLLFWNEGRAVTTARSLAEGAGLVHTVAADRIDPANEGRLIHVSGMLTAAGPALDTEFGMKSNGVRLMRRVEMFQWTEEQDSETQKKLGGGETTKTTYRYAKNWADHPIDSTKFKERSGHTNPQMTYRDRFVVAPQPRLGAFAVPSDLLRNFGAEEPLAVADEQLQAIGKRLNKPVQAVDGVLYVSQDPAQPAVGDLRIAFADVRLQPASIVAAQAGSGLGPYRTQAGGNVELIAAGQVSAASMFKEAQDENRLITWLLRAGGVLAMFIGFNLIMGPIGTIADVIPFLGDVVRIGTGLMAFLCTVSLAPIVIAIAWFYYRPLVAVAVLAVGAAVVYGIVHWSRGRAAAQRKAAPVSR
jgi:hypothetical protein